MEGIQIAKDVWQFNEGNENGPYVDAYLIVGAERALLVDALMARTELYDAVRTVTDLPLAVVLTHGHPDHAGKGLYNFLEKGAPVYASPLDYPMLGANFPLEAFRPANDGQRFHLGGTTLEVIHVGGHTAGSLVVYDRENNQLFSGDSIGSGMFWMQISGALPLSSFLINIDRLLSIVGEGEDLMVYPGHRNQSPVQLTGKYVRDVRIITQRLVSGAVQGEDAHMSMLGMEIDFKRVAYGLMRDYCYDPKRLTCEGEDGKG